MITVTKTLRSMVIIGLFLFGASNLLQAQESSESEDKNAPYIELKPNAISFGYLGAGEARDNNWILPSIAYRRQVKEGQIRAVVGAYFEQNYSNGGSFDELNGISAKIGYQYRIIDTRLSPKVGIDLSGGSYFLNDVYSNNDGYKKESAQYVGLSPNLGLEFWITPAISLSVETRMDFLVREMKRELYTNYGGNPSSSNSVTSGFVTRYSPISLFYISLYI